jgi:AraC-like DNA-binding protein
VHEGSCLLEVADGTTRVLREGDVVVLPRGDSHVLRSLPAAEEAPTGRRHGGGCALLCGAFLVREHEHPVLGALPHVVSIPRAEEPAVGPLVDALVVSALRFHARTAPDAGWLGGLRDPRIAPVLTAVHRDPAHPWTVEELAAVSRLSRAAFSARFTAQVGQPAMRYVTAIRMQRARTLLRDEGATVASVATRLGYGSEVAFAAAFKRVTGQNPGRYRRTATAAVSH